MSEIEHKNIFYYIIPWFLFYIFSFYLLTTLGYEKSFLFLNTRFNVELFNNFFVFITLFGDFAIALGIVLIAKHKDKDIINAIIFLSLVGIVIQFLKKIVFSDWNRPLLVFPDNSFYYLEVVRLTKYSFPSGHSAISVAWTLLVSRKVRNKFYSLLLGIFAIIVSYSRVYIGVHFLGDVVAGSLLAFGVYFLFYYYIYIRKEVKIPIKSKFFLYSGILLIIFRIIIYVK